MIELSPVNAPTNPLHLLVVDDDEIDRERVQRYLARSPIKVVTHEATSGEEALRMVRMQPFDCVVLDNQLGDTTGSDLLPKLHKEACKDCPVIMVTGAGNEELVVQALQDGATDYLSKIHLTEGTLVRSVMRSLETHRMRHELDDMHRQLACRVEEQAATIRQRERDLQDILDHTPSLIGYWDRLRCVRFGNRAHEAWFGIAPDALPGTSIREAIGEQMYEIHEPYIEKALRGQPQLFEHTWCNHADDQLRHLQAEYRPDVNEAGEVLGFYVTVTDITQIKAAQTRIETLLRFVETVIDNSPVGIAVYTTNERCVLANAEMAALTGMSVDLIKQQLLPTLVAGHAIEPDLYRAAQVTLSDGQTRHLEAAIQVAPDKSAQIAWSLARIERGDDLHLLLIARDVTEQKLMHENLVNARNSATEAARITSAFLANMSHEIRTPMNAIVGLSRLALEDKLPLSAHDHIQRVHDSALALMGILDDVLDYSKVEAGQMRLEQTDIELEEMLQRVADLFSGRVAQKRLNFEMVLTQDVPTHIIGDPLRLSQILNNLVGNAVKFTDQGCLRVFVCVEATLLKFEVHDTGPGIDPARHDALFAPFAQEDVSITRRFGGTGLGLAICKKLVDMMGGHIGVDSQPGRGSKFWFAVPLRVPSPAKPPLVMLDCQVLLVSPGQESPVPLMDSLQTMCQSVVVASDLHAACASIGNHLDARTSFDAIVLNWRDTDVHAMQSVLRGLHDWLRQQGVAHVSMVMLLPGFERQSLLDTASDIQPDVLLVQPVLPRTLYMALRRVRQLKEVHIQPASPAQLLKLRGLPLAGQRIMLVEDNVLNQMVARAFLQQAGLEVETLNDGAEAVRRMEHVQPGYFSAILMDMHMPVLDGLEASRRIAQMPQAHGLPIIAMTAAVLPADRQRCIEAGMVDMITKPIIPEALVDTLIKWFSH